MKWNVYLSLLLICLFQTSLSKAEDEQAAYNIKVEINNQLPAERFSDNWPVHIYLTAPDSRIPLSSTTTQLDKLPLKTVLTEKDYVLPMYKLIGHKQLVLVAKVSSSGDPHKEGPEDYRQVSNIFTLDSNNKAQAKLILGN